MSRRLFPPAENTGALTFRGWPAHLLWRRASLCFRPSRLCVSVSFPSPPPVPGLRCYRAANFRAVQRMSGPSGASDAVSRARGHAPAFRLVYLLSPCSGQDIGSELFIPLRSQKKEGGKKKEQENSNFCMANTFFMF